MGKYRFTITASDAYMDELTGDEIEYLRDDLKEITEDYGFSDVKVAIEDPECFRRNEGRRKR